VTVCEVSPHLTGWDRTSIAVPPALRRDHRTYSCCDDRVITSRDGKPVRSRTVIPQVGALIREARKRAGLSQRELAELAGVSQAMVASWERGLRGIYLVDLLTVAEVLGVHPAALLPVPPPVPAVVFAGPYVCERCGIEGES
jgi:DNA-binding XRE family transcriptional regulator